MLWKQFVAEAIALLRPLYEDKEAKNILMLLLQHRHSQFTYNDLLNNTPIPKNELPQLQNDLKQLQTGKPIQYIINECWFYKYPFYVNEHCLIPRPETEELVLHTIQQIQQLNNINYPKILDVGTGSGCIGICVKKELPNSLVTAIDINRTTLNIAKRNAKQLAVNINLILDDILHEASYVQQQSYDVIVSNPPYIPISEQATMHKNVLDHEPHAALFVTDNDPLIFYKAIAKLGSKNKAVVCCEISENLGLETVAVFKAAQCNDVKLHKDLQQKDRVIVANFAT